MSSLADVLAWGEGIERPFKCEEHDDTSASASVNVLKGVWHCFACGASGKVDSSSKKAPSLELLQSMLEPERAPRIYSSAYLELFDNDLGNWAGRFPAWLRWTVGFGCDPVTLDATFPVRTPNGRLAGVGRRLENPGEGESRFRYPPNWSASRSMFWAGHGEVLMLTEGASDAAAGWEIGVWSAACYGAGVHAPQLELIARAHPRLILLGFDSDEAGRRAIHGHDTTAGRGKKKSKSTHIPGALELLQPSYEVAVVDWSLADTKDAAATAVPDRKDLIVEVVRGTDYGRANPRFADTIHNLMLLAQADHYTRE